MLGRGGGGRGHVMPGMGFFMPGFAAPYGKGGKGQQQPSAAHHEVATLPFGGPKRSVSEHIGRAPHRCLTTFDDELESFDPSWSREDVGELLEEARTPVAFSVAPPSETFVPPAPERAAGAVDVRAFICGGIAPGRGHILSRISVVAGSRRRESGRGGVLAAYGGKVAATTPQAQQQALVQMLKEQAGVDLSYVQEWRRLCVFEYSDGERTVFYLPVLHGETEIKFAHQATETVASVEEAEEYEEDGEQKRRTVAREKRLHQSVVTPDVQSLASLRMLRPDPEKSRAQAELCQAADAYDEWLLRDAVREIAAVLERKAEQEARKRAEQEAHTAKAVQRKRKRDEIVEGCKRRRQERETECQERCGETDAEQQAELARIAEQFTSELSAETAEFDKVCVDEDAAAGRPSVRVEYRRHQPSFDLFQLLDRPRGLQTAANTIDREYLAKMLLSGGIVPCMKQAVELAALGDAALSRRPFVYGVVCQERREIDTDTGDTE